MMSGEYPKKYVIDKKVNKLLNRKQQDIEHICTYLEKPEIYKLVGDKCRSKKQRAVDDFLFIIMDTITGIFDGINLLKDYSKTFYLVYSENQYFIVIISNNEIEIDKLPDELVNNHFIYKNYEYHNLGKI